LLLIWSQAAREPRRPRQRRVTVDGEEVAEVDRPAVLQHLEVVARQAADPLAALVGDEDLQVDDLDVDGLGVDRLGGVSCWRGCPLAAGDPGA